MRDLYTNILQELSVSSTVGKSIWHPHRISSQNKAGKERGKKKASAKPMTASSSSVRNGNVAESLAYIKN